MLKSLVAAVLSALVLFGGGPASAQTSEAETVGIELARTLFRAISFEDLIAKEVGGAGNPFGDVPSRPEWTGYLIDALREEIAHDLPVFEGRFGRTLAKEFSLAELRVGLVILSDPMMQAAMRAASESDGAAEPQGQPSREIRRALASPEGVAFMNKLERLDRYLQPLQDDLAAELLPGALRRFADKVDAGEAARRERAASQP